MKSKKRKSNIRDNTRTVVITMSILFFLTVAGFYLFNWYINIDIKKPTENQNYTASKTSRHGRRSKTAK